MKNVILYFMSDFTVSGIMNGLIEKAIIAGIFGLILYLIKPIRKRIIKWFRKITGREKYSVIVTGYVFRKGEYNNKNLYFNFEIELPFKDISEDVMPISESTRLVLKEVNRKYQTDFFPSGYDLNNVVIQKKTV